ncbi:MAG TPA: AEC family transporter [Streptosporangiaceae bacterium]|nr:AEC family transporter [Streptosporangiaceae bacterium]
MGMLRAFEPIWLLAAIGYAARRWGLLGDTALTALAWFVFHVAMPAALYVRLAATTLGGFDGRELGAFAASLVATIGVGWYFAGRFFHRKHGERAIWGMASGYGNAANLGIPLAMQVLGNISFLVEVLLLQTLIVSPVILATLDRHAAGGGELRFRRVATLPLRNPVILGSALGIAASATGFHATSVVQTPLKLLATTAVPAALIALGASLCQREKPTDVGRAEISVITVLKLVAQPALACAAGLALQLPQPELLAVVVCAALPTAQNTFVFARQYDVGEGLASRSVIVTTTLSLATIAAVAAMLGH